VNKFILASGLLFLICFSSVFAEENLSIETSEYAETSDIADTTEHGTTALGISLEVWVTVAHWLTGLGTIALTIALFKTFHHLDASTKMAKTETEYRLRPWIGPTTGIKRMDNSISGDLQFSITIKNFGDLPANYVKAKSIVSTTPLTKESLKQTMSEFNLGPVLPRMEKSYLIFITPDMWKKVADGNDSLYVALYFEYPSLSGSNGYGSLSEYNKTSQIFIHKEMWLDYPEVKFE
jgi:hypothetical protein